MTMYMVEITENKMSNLAEHVEEALKHMGKVMQCVSELSEEDSRESYYHRNPIREEEYSNREYRGTGRYSKY